MENKVSKKPIIQIDIELWMPSSDAIKFIDLKDYLFREMIIKEAEFREQVDETDWPQFTEKYVIIHNSSKAIIPQWAFFLISSKLSEASANIIFEQDNHREKIITKILSDKDYSEYENKRVLIKGCGKENFSMMPYTLLIQKLTPIVRAISYGEACSMVPVFRR